MVYAKLTRMAGMIGLILLAGAGLLKAGPDWSGQREGLGYLALDGGLRLDLQLGVLPGSEEFSFPLTLRHEIKETGGEPAVVSEWAVPQLTSYVVPEQKGAILWVAPGGREQLFAKHEILASPPDRFANEWVCVARGNEKYEIHSRDGWRYTYDEGVLQSLRAPSGRQLRFEMDRVRVQAIVLQGNNSGGLKILEAEWAEDNRLLGLNVGPYSHKFVYENGEDALPRLTLWKANTRQAAPVQFSYTDGLIERIDDHGPGNLAFEWMMPGTGWISQHTLNLPDFASPVLLSGVNKTDYSYDTRPNGVDLIEEDANGAVSRLRLDYRSQESTLFRPDGSELVYEYFGRNNGPSAGKLARISSGSGDERLRVKYNDFGDVLAIKRGERPTTLFSYDDLGRLVRREQIGRPPTVWSYKGTSQQPASVTNAAGEQVRFLYDASGDLLEIVDLRGKTHRFHYDALGRMTRHDFPLGYHREIVYDDWGRVVGMTDLDGTRTDIEFGENARVAAVEKGVHLWSYTYSLTGELAEVHRNGQRILDRTLEPLAGGDWRLLLRDVHGAQTEKRFNAEGQIVATSDALGNKMQYAYDPVGRLAGWTDPRGATVRFKHDPLGRVTLIENSLGNGESRRYGKDGRLLHRDNGEQEIDYAYNEAGRLAETDFGNGEVVEHRYDDFGRIIETTAGDVPTRYQYDVLDRVTLKATQLPDGSVHSVAYAYTPTGQKASVRYYSREADEGDPTLVSETSNEYDALGRLVRIEADGQPKVLYQYDPSSLRLAAKHFASGQKLAYRYDSSGRTTLMQVTDSTGEVIERITYSWSPDGRLAERVREGSALAERLENDPNQIQLVSGMTPEEAENQDSPVRLIQHYHYDPLGRLVAVKFPGLPNLNEAYVYDASGNLLEKTQGEASRTFTYDLANQLKSRRDADGILTRYQYDQAGRMTAELVNNQPVATYAYGYRDRMLELVRYRPEEGGVVRGDTAVKFHYDGAGMIVGKQRGTIPAPGPQIAKAGFGFSRDKTPEPVYESGVIEPWVWEDAFGAGGAPRGGSQRGQT